MRKINVSACQMGMSTEVEENIRRASLLAEKAAEDGANIILLPELFETPYFCQERKYGHYGLAHTVDEDPAVRHFKKLAAKLHAVIPVSFYEKAGTVLYNSLAMIDADGELLGIYRKTHIPDDHFYQEKFYFTPGDTGFKVWDTAFGKIGAGICWDQWFPESARCMALKGAEILLYPTAIGSEPVLETDSMPHWRRCMQGHAAANLMPLAAANRIGTETVTASDDNNMQSSSLVFYGSSFICDHTGEIKASADRDSDMVISSQFDLDELYEFRMSWGVFRDRRPEMYGVLSGKKTDTEA